MYKQLRILKRRTLGVRNSTRVWGVSEEIVRRIAALRESSEKMQYGMVETLNLTPTDEEHEARLVNHDIYCPRCDVHQFCMATVQRK